MGKHPHVISGARYSRKLFSFQNVYMHTQNQIACIESLSTRFHEPVPTRAFVVASVSMESASAQWGTVDSIARQVRPQIV